MQKDTLEYIRNRATENDTASIKAVSCADVRALLEERAALIEALKLSVDVAQWTIIPLEAIEYKDTAKQLRGAIESARAAIAKAAA